MEKREKNSKLIKYISLAILLMWFAFIIRLTVSGREAIDEYRIKTAFFWTLRDAWSKKSAQIWFYLVANIYIFVPLGLLLPIVFKKMRSFLNIAVSGLACSFTIEVIQFFFKLGYFEFDDLFNNTLGTVLGYALYVVTISIAKKHNSDNKEVLWSTGIIIVLMSFFIIATMLGQPVFDAIGKYFSYYMNEFFF